MSEQRKQQPQGGGPMGHGGGGNDDEPVKRQRILKEHYAGFFGYLKPRRNQLIAVFFAAILSTVFTIVWSENHGNCDNRII